MAILRALALSVVLAGCGACGVAFVAPTPEQGLSLSDQEALTVKVYACAPKSDGFRTGSGVIVSSRHVITAEHVIKGCSEITVETADGYTRSARLDAVHRRDLARLSLELPVDHVPPVALASAVPGSVACFTPGTPHRILECGEVTMIDWREWRGEILLDAKVVKGNSGSPLWDAEGRLIGVVVTCEVFDGTRICLPRGGGASSFVGAKWLVEDAGLQ